MFSYSVQLKEYNESETSSEDDEEDMDADLAGAAAAVDDEGENPPFPAK